MLGREAQEWEKWINTRLYIAKGEQETKMAENGKKAYKWVNMADIACWDDKVVASVFVTFTKA